MRKEDESIPNARPDEQGSDITKGILEHKSSHGLEQVLASIPPSELESILLEAYALRARKLSVYDVLRQYESNAFVQPAVIDQKEQVLFESFVVRTLPQKTRLIELSPVTALGTNSVLSDISQRTVLGTTRNTEVVADGVTVLTLELAKLRRLNKNDKNPIDLGTFQRELRTQKHATLGYEIKVRHFRTYEDAEQYIKDVYQHNAIAIFSLIGFYLDKPINRIGWTGWNILEHQVQNKELRMF